MHGAQECLVADPAGESDEKAESDVRNQKCRPAEFADPVGEHPYICHTHGAADAGEDKSPLVIEFIF